MPIDDVTLDGVRSAMRAPLEYTEGMSTPSQGAAPRWDTTGHGSVASGRGSAAPSEDAAGVLRPPRSLRSVFLYHMDALVAA